MVDTIRRCILERHLPRGSMSAPVSHVRIDFLATKPGSSEVWLVVADGRDWTDVPAHMEYLQEKINDYIAAAQSGAVRRHPMVRNIAQPELWVMVFGMFEPPEDAKAMLAEVDAALCEFGLRFRYEHRPLPLAVPQGVTC